MNKIQLENLSDVMGMEGYLYETYDTLNRFVCEEIFGLKCKSVNNKELKIEFSRLYLESFNATKIYFDKVLIGVLT